MPAHLATAELIDRLFTTAAAFGEPRDLLDGLDGETAVQVPPGLERSVAALVAHCAFWLELYLHAIRTGDAGALDRPWDDWPPVDSTAWPALRERFGALCAEATALAADPLAPATVAIHGRDIPVARLLADLGGHNLYHLGQVMLIRKLLGA